MYEPITISDLGFFLQNVTSGFSPLILFGTVIMFTFSVAIGLKKLFLDDLI